MSSIPSGDFYYVRMAIERLEALGIPSLPEPARQCAVHPCPWCGQEVFVLFRGLGRTARILDAEDDCEHRCPPPPSPPKAKMPETLPKEGKPKPSKPPQGFVVI